MKEKDARACHCEVHYLICLPKSHLKRHTFFKGRHYVKFHIMKNSKARLHHPKSPVLSCSAQRDQTGQLERPSGPQDHKIFHKLKMSNDS